MSGPGESIRSQVNTDEYAHQVLGGHLRVWRHDGQPVVCDWDTLQAIKNEALGEDVWVIEVFPAEDSVINEFNMRHFWIVDPDMIPHF